MDKQLRRFSPATRSDGTLILALVAAFLAGMTIGAFAFAYKVDPTRMAATAAALAQPVYALPIAR
ncbi:MAG: hypothetical protein WBD95_06430 [Xanthobacteraceae bacterium]